MLNKTYFILANLCGRKKEIVDYRILSPRDLAKSAMSEGGLSKYLVCIYLG